MSKFNPDYYESCGDLFLVYQWDTGWKRYVNTHAYPKSMENAEYHAQAACRKPRTTTTNKSDWRNRHGSK